MMERDGIYDRGMVFGAEGATVVPALHAAFQRWHLAAVRSFDLRSALAANSDCTCPHHGTAQCTCQFVVLLVYGEAAEPVVLTIHSRQSQTQAQIVHDAASAPDPGLAGQVMAVLLEVALALHTSPPPGPGVTAQAAA